MLGMSKGRLRLQGYQVGGQSATSGIPEWRYFDLAGMTDVRVLDTRFAGPRPGSAPTKTFESVLAQIAATPTRA